ncbi:auxin-responsive protein IAA4-like [Magnolia sinica]|uniref:auxin-responsive protein IAA4-like n=1 Tax=Magnolia sinica TaxID=86752 RepID=UPI00265A56A9|nr:auxin-responsive protein IAA4-like [Magnolia sinica]
MGRHSNSSSSSSTDSNPHPSLSSASSLSTPKRDLSTDLRLGLSISTVHDDNTSNSRDQRSDWPPIKPLLRSTLAESGNHCNQPTFFVKVYMEGVPIGRKLDLFAHDGYDGLVRTLRRMFGTAILCPNFMQASPNQNHVLTYEDKEGDWMMVGDVPWEMFLTTVKRLKITRADKC